MVDHNQTLVDAAYRHLMIKVGGEQNNPLASTVPGPSSTIWSGGYSLATH